MNSKTKSSLAALLFGIATVVTPIVPAGLVVSGLWSSTAIADVNGHNTVIRIGFEEQLPLTKQIIVGLSKTTMVELPRDLRDVVVSNPEVLDAVVQSSNRVYLIGKAKGSANIFFFDESGEQVLTLEVAVEKDSSSYESLVKRLIPGSSIKAEVMNDNIILTGTVLNPSDASRASDLAARFIAKPGDSADPGKVINMLKAEGKEQVLLKVTVAEVNRDVIKRFGVNWNGLSGGGMGYTTNSLFPVTGSNGIDSTLFGVSGSGGAACAAAASISAAAAGTNCIAAQLDAFERTGLLRTLAEPNITAISGETANFLAGGEYPIPLVDKDGSTSVEFKPFGVSLAFTPLVLSESRISLKIASEVSELSSEAAVLGIPGLKVRRASSTVELPSGGSLVIAGLVSEATRQNIEGVPGLKKLPILGALFRSRDFQKQETELVIIVTPYTVNPVNRSALARPDDGLVAASDLNATFMGQLNKVYGREEVLPDGDYEGKFGFIVE